MGANLVAAVDEILEEVADWPKMGAVVLDIETEHPARRFPLHRFPYHVVWVVTGDELWVIAVAHDHQEPGYWRRRVAGL